MKKEKWAQGVNNAEYYKTLIKCSYEMGEYIMRTIIKTSEEQIIEQASVPMGFKIGSQLSLLETLMTTIRFAKSVDDKKYIAEKLKEYAEILEKEI